MDMVGVLFLALSLLAVPICNGNQLVTIDFSSSGGWIYSFVMIVICALAVQGLRICAKTANKKKYVIYVLIAASIAYDVLSLIYFKINPLTYIAQILIIGIYFFYQRLKSKSENSL